ncbi:MAG: hypothetical protein ACAH06_00035 [Methylophilaceae bacterium]|jgi:hypothetical protein
MQVNPKYSRDSVLIRILGGIIGVSLCLMALFSVFVQHEFPIGEGRYGLLMPFLGLVFIAYAIAGPELFKKFTSQRPNSNHQNNQASNSK